MIEVATNNGNLTMQAVFVTSAGLGQNASLLAYVDISGQIMHDHSIGYTLSPPSPPDVGYTTIPLPYVVSLKIANPDYGLKYYTIKRKNHPDVKRDLQTYHYDGTNLTNPSDLYANGGDGTYTITLDPTQTDNPSERVYFSIGKLIRKLTAIVKRDDNLLPDGTDVTFNTGSKTYQYMWCAIQPQPLFSTTVNVLSLYEAYVKSTIYYYSGTPVSIVCGAADDLPRKYKTTMPLSGYHFKHWESSSPNTRNNGSNPSLPQFNIAHDEYVTAVFQAGFRLLSLSYYQWVGPAPGVDPTNKNVNDPWGGDPNGKPVLQTFPVGASWIANKDHPSASPRAWAYGLWAGSSTTWAPPTLSTGGTLTASTKPHTVLHFNKPIAANIGQVLNIRVDEASPTYGRDWVMYYQPVVGTSIDFHPSNAILLFPTHLDMSLGGVPPAATGNANGEIVTTCGATSWAIWKGQHITLNVTEGVKSTSGFSLSNPQIFDLYTEDPDITWYYTNSHVNDAHTDWCCWPMTSAWTGLIGAFYPGVNVNTGSIQEYHKISGWLPAISNGSDMHYFDPVSLPTIVSVPNVGDRGRGGNWDITGAGETVIASCSHCAADRQFEAVAEVWVTRTIPNCFWIPSNIGDENGGALEDWEYGYVNVTHAINNGIISLTNKGRMDQVFELMGLDLINGNEDAGLDFDNGRAHFPLTQVHPSSDFWGAGRSSYNWSADSRGGSGSFRADIRVEIK